MYYCHNFITHKSQRQLFWADTSDNFSTLSAASVQLQSINAYGSSKT